MVFVSTAAEDMVRIHNKILCSSSPVFKGFWEEFLHIVVFSFPPQKKLFWPSADFQMITVFSTSNMLP